MDERIYSLNERAKELECLYQIEAALSSPDEAISTVCYAIVRAIPPGWQYPEVCKTRIRLEGEVYSTSNFELTPWTLSQPIVVDGEEIGEIQVCYTERMPDADIGPFLTEEAKLISTIASRLAHYVQYVHLTDTVKRRQAVRRNGQSDRSNRWQAVIETLRRTDGEMYLKVSRRMATHLYLRGVLDAEELLRRFGSGPESALAAHAGTHNGRNPAAMDRGGELGADVFDLAARQLDDATIMELIQKWVREDQLSTLERIVSTGNSWSSVRSALRRIHPLEPDTARPESASYRGLQVALVRRLFSDQLHFINSAKNYIDIPEVYRLLDRVISCTGSLGRLGEKSAGLYLVHRILAKNAPRNSLLAGVKIPRSWYVTSEGILHFVQHNGFDEFIEQKYKSDTEIDAEYPYVLRAFASAQLPSDIVSALSVALDDLGDTPLIVRNSSLLEGGVGASFSGKYDSVFLTNTGNKTERLQALMRAIARVYASTLNPEALAYRANHGFIDLVEEMGILIQQVVGRKIGRYFLPTISGVAFSRNEMQWAPGVTAESGLIRLVPGLGPRAVNRVGSECPIMMTAFGRQIRYRTPAPPEETHRSRTLEAINPATTRIETFPVDQFLQRHGDLVPDMRELASPEYTGTGPQEPGGGYNQVSSLELSSLVRTVGEMLKTAESALGYPVEIEFASDGHAVYLLQCRPQNRLLPEVPPHLPTDISRNHLLFASNQFVNENYFCDVSHIVFVDPASYPRLEEEIGPPAVGQLLRRVNQRLADGRYVLIGPAYSDTYGGVLFGSTIRYSSISHCALLVEVSQHQTDCRPESIFGTHFYKDLVEGGIRYLPLYPSGGERMVNFDLLRSAENRLSEFVPDFGHATDAVKVIDARQLAHAHVVRIMMNANPGRAIAVLTGARTEGNA